jgi:cell division protein FtsN
MSRIESARRRAGGVKRALTVLAAAGLIVTGLLARATNLGHAAAATGATRSSSSVTGSESESESSDDFSIAPAPSSSPPQAQTHVS